MKTKQDVEIVRKALERPRKRAVFTVDQQALDALTRLTAENESLKEVLEESMSLLEKDRPHSIKAQLWFTKLAALTSKGDLP